MNWQSIVPIIQKAVRQWLNDRPSQLQRLRNWKHDLRHFFKIEAISAEELLLLINERKLDGKVVVKTNVGFAHQPDDAYTPSQIIFLVMEEHLALKILALGYLPILETKNQ